MNKTGVVPAVCRDLIAVGVDPETAFEVYRDGTLCFRHCSGRKVGGSRCFGGRHVCEVYEVLRTPPFPCSFFRHSAISGGK